MNTRHYHFCVDGYEANQENRVGSNVFAFEILWGLAELTDKEPNARVTVVLPKPALPSLPKPTERWQYQVVTPTQFWTQWALPLHIFRHHKQYSAFFTPSHYAPRFCAVPYISSVMDTAYLEFPDLFKRSDLTKLVRWTAYSVKHATRVIGISNFTKQSIIKHYKKPRNAVAVVYPAALLSENIADPSTLKELGIQDSFFLFVGTIQPRKNIERLVEAYELYCRLFNNLPITVQKRKKVSMAQLVLAGKTGWLSAPIMNCISRSPEQQNIITTGFIDDTVKARLYRNARATLLVGLHEGFGIPPLESMGYGTIPIVSNTSSLPEVVGEAGFQVDPYSPQEIAQAMLDAQLLTPRRRALYRRKGKEQFSMFNWNRSAEKVWQLMKEVAQQHDD